MPSPAEVETVSAAPVPEDPAGYSWLHSLPSPDSVATTPDNSRPASPLMFNTYEGRLCNFDIDTEIIMSYQHLLVESSYYDGFHSYRIIE